MGLSIFMQFLSEIFDLYLDFIKFRFIYVHCSKCLIFPNNWNMYKFLKHLKLNTNQSSGFSDALSTFQSLGATQGQ